MPERDSDALLSALYEAATDGRYLYRHRWSAGDVLVWDNASTLHKGLPTDAGRKVMWRITIDGASWCSNQTAREQGS